MYICTIKITFRKVYETNVNHESEFFVLSKSEIKIKPGIA